MSQQNGFLIWITGLAGSGKTTLGGALKGALDGRGTPTILLDGDALREAVGGVFGYSSEERLRCAQFYTRLCRLLTSQGQNVICCTISMFDSVRAENRRVNPRYVEVFLNTSEKILKLRNQKDLYLGDSAKHVVGVDLKLEFPKNPDLEFTTETDLNFMVAQVLSLMKKPEFEVVL